MSPRSAHPLARAVTDCRYVRSTHGAIVAGYTTVPEAVTEQCVCNGGALTTGLRTLPGLDGTSYLACDVTATDNILATILPPSSATSTSTSTSTAVPTPPVKKPKPIPNLTVQMWNDGGRNTVVSWLRAQYEHWDPLSGVNFHTNLTDTFAPRLLNTISQCDGSNTCSPVSCDFIDMVADQNERKGACWALNALSVFANTHNVIHDAAGDACQSMSDNMDSMVDAFTDVQQEKAYKKAKDKEMKMIFDMIQMVTLIVGPFVGPAAAGVEALEEVASLIGAVTSAMNGEITTMKNILGILKADPEAATKLKDQMKTTFADVCLKARSGAAEIVTNQLAGKKMKSGKTIVDQIESGQFAIPLQRTSDLDSKAHEHYFKIALSNLWKILGWTYIVVADAVNNDCSGDIRSPKQAKKCIANEPALVFEPLFIGEEKEGADCEMWVRNPPGFKLVEGGTYGNTSWNSIVGESWRFFKAYGNMDRADVGAQSSDKPWWDPDGTLPEVFDIPICYSPNGDALSNIQAKNGRNYPCMCSAWGGGDGSHAFQQKSALYRSNQYADYCNGQCKVDYKGPELTFDEAKNGAKEKHLRWPYTSCKVGDHIKDRGNKGYQVDSDDGTRLSPMFHCRNKKDGHARKAPDAGDYAERPECKEIFDHWND